MRPFAGLKLIPSVLAALALGGCASDPVPDVAYYRLPAFAVPAQRDGAAFAMPIEVEPFTADGVYNEQPILHADGTQASLRPYHYQLWGDPPVRLLQRRLIDLLRASKVSSLVADRLPPSVDALHVSGLIQHFERVKTDAGWTIRVQLEFRVERGESAAPVLLRQYVAERNAADLEMPTTVQSFGDAVDHCFAQFLADLIQLKTEPVKT